MKKVFFPGSFNPFTKGHADIVCRMLKLADTVVIGIGINTQKEGDLAEKSANAEAIRKIFSGPEFAGKVEVTVYSGLTMEKARELNADCVVRGVRGAADFEYEFSLAAANRAAFGIETILLPADPVLSCVSSSIVRDLIRFGRPDIAEKFLP